MINIYDAINVKVNNKINGNFGQIPKEQTMYRSYNTLHQVVKRGLK